MTAITIIGGGVIGLSAGLNLRLAGFDVRILTRDALPGTASFAAGAVWSGGGATGRALGWARDSLQHFLKLAGREDSGVVLSRMRLVYSRAVDDPWYRGLLPFFRRIPDGDLPAGRQAGFLMDVPVVAPPRYLTYLREQFLDAGGTLETREVESLRTMAEEGSLLVNCTGVWARDVAGDDAVFPIRGQTLLIDAPKVSEGYMRETDTTYLFPRGDGLLIGGVYQYHSWNREVNPRQTEDILQRCARIEPSVREAPILRTAVGLRPGRDSVRLEVERLSPDCAVIHNYGHGSIGFTLSWGCALETLDLARDLTGDSI